jgi:hypothetical protein
MAVFGQISAKDVQEVEGALQIYQDSFPQNERHPIEVILERLHDGRYMLIVGHDGSEVVFFALLWPLRDTEFVLLDYMATKSSHRHRGIASEFLRGLPHSAETAGKFLVLEVENPARGDNRQERAKRVDFYRRQGIMELQGVRYILPGLSGGDPTEMILMMFPQYDEGKIDGAKVRKIITQIYQELYARDSRDTLLNSFIREIKDRVQLI